MVSVVQASNRVVNGIRPAAGHAPPRYEREVRANFGVRGRNVLVLVPVDGRIVGVVPGQVNRTPGHKRHLETGRGLRRGLTQVDRPGRDVRIGGVVPSGAGAFDHGGHGEVSGQSRVHVMGNGLSRRGGEQGLGTAGEFKGAGDRAGARDAHAGARSRDVAARIGAQSLSPPHLLVPKPTNRGVAESTFASAEPAPLADSVTISDTSAAEASQVAISDTSDPVSPPGMILPGSKTSR